MPISLRGSIVTISTTLTSDIQNCAGDRLDIGADGVWLNCGNHKITGLNQRADFSGITASNRTNVVIANCLIQGFEYAWIRIDQGTSGFLLENDTVWVGTELSNSATGNIPVFSIFLDHASDGTIENSVISSGHVCLQRQYGVCEPEGELPIFNSRNILVSNMTHWSSSDAFNIQASNHVTVAYSDIFDLQGYGRSVFLDDASNITVAGNNIYQENPSGGNEIVIQDSSNSSVINNNIALQSQQSVGIYIFGIFSSPHDIKISGNYISGGYAGIEIIGYNYPTYNIKVTRNRICAQKCGSLWEDSPVNLTVVL